MTPFSNKPVGATVETCSAAKNETPHWVEIELIGENGKGIPYEEYSVTLPSGEKRSGLLDDQGFARLEGLPDGGDCKITFPRLDGGAWEFTETANAR
jgi:hypothetical protein